ncbi:MAG: hypothetical protein GTO63_03820, partial [Anaerolineae bacterium]|nr:hypothetical protein [Anaerolineae bacterium]
MWEKESRTMLRKIALATLVGTLLLVSSLALPAPVAAQQTGPWVDEIIFSVIPQEQAVASVSAGDTDIYVFPLETPTDKVAARDDPNIDTYEAVTGLKDMWVNPVPFDPTATDKINPFVVREAREALNYAIDREHIIAEILGGFGLPYVAHHFRNQPDYARDAGFFAKLEAKYSYDPSKAKAQMESALATVPGVTIEDG